MRDKEMEEEQDKAEGYCHKFWCAASPMSQDSKGPWDSHPVRARIYAQERSQPPTSEGGAKAIHILEQLCRGSSGQLPVAVQTRTNCAAQAKTLTHAELWRLSSLGTWHPAAGGKGEQKAA